MAASKFASNQFTIFALLFTVLFLVLFGIFGRYSGESLPNGTPDFARVSRDYPLLHDTHGFVLIGLGFLVAFLRRYGFSALAINLLLVAFVLEWGLIIRGFLSPEFSQHSFFSVGLKEIAKADYTAAAVLISYGALVGKLSPIQYLFLAFLETPLSIVNEFILFGLLGVGDVGGSIVVHLFGAVFGLAVARIVFKPSQIQSEHQGSIYHSDIFSFVGTVFLWAFWPSFNSIFALSAAEQQRAIITTFLALLGSTVTTFLFSQLLNKEKRFNFKHIASATLSGGVATGAVATLVLSPLAALLIGVVAAIISVLGFNIITPLLAHKLGVHDTRGVFSLHGLPGIVGGLASVILLFLTPTEVFGETIRNIYPFHKTDSKDGRTPAEQALFQLAGLGITILFALVTGVITGVILRLKIWRQVREKENYSDTDFFDVPEDFDFTTRVTSHIERVELTEHTERTKLTNNEYTN
ncbi:unnamed protein product [Bursaphelenchus okinawaensis]|uniref:Ammonium transporter AmtB-like domain-containing protein n=1 Tax=Bursaphelenchus okinawaensis TaxID=465554 RepID=A0A811L6F2_9BILA|nr:unnamed protein product [Bursaphelenchus okinawaensis]CAG9118486.1 unnamed protein product [Bursaphelenchus okinawaensis]